MAVKRQKTSDELANNWAAGMASPTTAEKYKKGISAYSGNPMAEAASEAATQRYLSNVQMAVSSGYRQARLNAADPAAWKNSAVTFGASNLSAGAQKKKPKYKKQMDFWAGKYAEASA